MKLMKEKALVAFSAGFCRSERAQFVKRSPFQLNMSRLEAAVDNGMRIAG